MGAQQEEKVCDLLRLGHASGKTYRDNEVYARRSKKAVRNWQDVQPLTVCIPSSLSSVDHDFGGGLDLYRPRCGETVSLHALTQLQSHMAACALCSPKADCGKAFFRPYRADRLYKVTGAPGAEREGFPELSPPEN